MRNPDNFQNGEHDRFDRQAPGLDVGTILNLILKNWYYFIIAVVLAFLIARFYISHTMPVYMSSAMILINETGESTAVGNEQLLQGMGLSGGMRNLENQIMILSSRALTEKALKELPFETEYYRKTLRNRLPVYPDIPVKIVTASNNSLPRDIDFSITYLGNNTFKVDSESDTFIFSKTASFGEDIETADGSFRIESLNENWFLLNRNEKLYFRINSSRSLTRYYNGRLNVELLSRTGSILMVSLAGTNREKDVDFLNKLAEVFQFTSLDKKNNEATRRIQFIDDQLIGISDSLSITESKLQQFRSSHRVMDLSAQGQAIIQQVTILENEKARLSLEANYYDYLADYLAKDVTGELPIVPITMGITDPGLTRLVNELAELQGQLSSRSTGEMNPLQNLLVQRVRSTKEALFETLNGLRRANSLARSENQEQINRVNSQASALPVTERQLLGIERKFRLNDEMYTFLLETRAEQQMQKASNVPDSEIVDPADVRYSYVISPDRKIISFMAFLLGTGIPFGIIFLRFLFNKKLREEDIEKLTNIPVIANIPHSFEKSIKVVFEYPDSSIAEAFRLMRSKMQFFTKELSSTVILVTSSTPEEGKTFTAINLASVYSMLGKKTVLLGFDLRKPKIYMDFDLDNENGISTFLIGQDNLHDIVKETSYENLSLISAGPVPPNPSELTALDKTEELIKILKQNYEIIIIDSSPIGIVSDAFHLASLTDACLLVVRPGVTLKDMLTTTLHDINLNKIKGLSLVVNDIQSANKYYRYGHKYGYIQDSKNKKSVFRKLINR